VTAASAPASPVLTASSKKPYPEAAAKRHPRTFLRLNLRRRAGVWPVTGRERRHGLWGWMLSGSAGGGAEATSDEPRLRRRSRRSTNTVKPSQAKATPKMSSTAGSVSMAKSRREPVSVAYSFPGLATTWFRGSGRSVLVFLSGFVSK
jgi:hypothetical protein